MPKIEKKKDQNQVKTFSKAARELGADESEERFKDTLRTIAKAKPSRQRAKEKNRETDRGE
jgi:hypothetical protein